MFGLNQIARTRTEAEAPTPREIAEGVRRKAEQILLERRLAGLRDRLAAVYAEIGRVHGGSDSDQQKGARIRELQVEQTEIEAGLLDCRHKLTPFRVRHGERVTEALGPLHRLTAQRAVDAMAQLDVALAAVNACNDEIRRAGGDAPALRLPSIWSLRRDLQRLASR